MFYSETFGKCSRAERVENKKNGHDYYIYVNLIWCTTINVNDKLTFKLCNN